MFKSVVLQGKSLGILDMGNGKFLALVIIALMAFVTMYTQYQTKLTAEAVSSLNTEMQISYSALRKDIQYLTADRDKLQASNKELTREIDRMSVMQQVNAASFSGFEEDRQKALLKQAIQQLRMEVNDGG